MHSLIGIDQPSIFAKLSSGLCKNGCNLGGSNMGRLGNYFNIMLMVEYEGSKIIINNIITSVCFTLSLILTLSSLRIAVLSTLSLMTESVICLKSYGCCRRCYSISVDKGLNILHIENPILVKTMMQEPTTFTWKELCQRG